MAGKFITFEGNEGSGKSTQIRRLAETLKNEGYDILLTREPGGSKGAEDIRALLVTGDPDRWSARTELLLFMAARNDHVERTIKPALAAGKIVLCDRYVGSTLALQAAGGENPDFISSMHDAFIGLWPDATIFLDINPTTGVQRGMDRGGPETRMEEKGEAYHRTVSSFFTMQCDASPNWHRVDAEGDIDTVSARVLQTVKPLL